MQNNLTILIFIAYGAFIRCYMHTPNTQCKCIWFVVLIRLNKVINVMKLNTLTVYTLHMQFINTSKFSNGYP